MLLNVSRRLTTGCVAHTEHRYIPRRNDDDNGDDNDARREQSFRIKKKKKKNYPNKISPTTQNAFEQPFVNPVRFTFSRCQESRRLQQVTPGTEVGVREKEWGEREGDNKTTTANSYRFEILRNKVYIPGERYSI